MSNHICILVSIIGIVMQPFEARAGNIVTKTKEKKSHQQVQSRHTKELFVYLHLLPKDIQNLIGTYCIYNYQQEHAAHLFNEAEQQFSRWLEDPDCQLTYLDPIENHKLGYYHHLQQSKTVAYKRALYPRNRFVHKDYIGHMVFCSTKGNTQNEGQYHIQFEPRSSHTPHRSFATIALKKPQHKEVQAVGCSNDGNTAAAIIDGKLYLAQKNISTETWEPLPEQVTNKLDDHLNDTVYIIIKPKIKYLLLFTQLGVCKQLIYSEKKDSHENSLELFFSYRGVCKQITKNS